MYSKLDPSIKQTWIDALRSNLYHQGRKQLGRKDTPTSCQAKFCCLGVLALTTPKVSKVYWVEENLCVPDSEPITGRFDEVSQIPAWLEDVYGLDPEAQSVLTEMNDRGDSFDTLAQWIQDWL